jgi:hypothetical protein
MMLSGSYPQERGRRWRAWITAAVQDAADGAHSPLERNYVNGLPADCGSAAERESQAERRS